MGILADVQIVKSSISLVLLLCAVLAFGRLLIFGDDESKKWQKIFGALVILIIALISENGWAVSIAVVIGGLIVASEDFMRFVAAIFKSNPDKIAETINAFKATDREVRDKLQEDVKEELEITPAPDEEPRQTSSDRARERMARVKEVEDLVQLYLKQNIRGYEPHQKITSRSGSIIVDGVIRRKNGKIGAIVEIRYITPKSFPILKYLISGFCGKLARVGISKRALVPVVSENMTVKDAQKMRDENKTWANLMFFRLSEGQLEVVDPGASGDSSESHPNTIGGSDRSGTEPE